LSAVSAAPSAVDQVSRNRDPTTTRLSRTKIASRIGSRLPTPSTCSPARVPGIVRAGKAHSAGSAIAGSMKKPTSASDGDGSPTPGMSW
jgi:hypothetical protein